ncbi:MAG TPA: L,D-transpeptidase [Devosiaceae bacterium]|jgi:lipoprotein-anchoring transpeptidase ErfK/SrfK
MIVNDGIADGGNMDGVTQSGRLNRRSFLLGSVAGVGALALAGCTTSGDDMTLAEAKTVYGPLPKERFPVPAVNVNKINPKFYRRTVRYDTAEAAGTIIVDPRNHYVYRIEGGGNATRYGASVGRAGFLWSGDAYIGRKAEWPIWTPPKEMIKRQPEAAKYAGGMAPGLDNPLGARTLYLYQNGVYTLYTLYSTHVAESIGKGVSSGCIGLLTQDMVDLYSKTPVKTKVVVLRA